MPCWEVNLMSVEFKGKSEVVLKELGGREIREGVWNVKRCTVDLKSGKVEGREEAINRLKRGYSREVLKKVAKRKGWVVKEKVKGKQFVFSRY